MLPFKDFVLDEDLRQWFKDRWVRMDTKGNIKGDCAREDGEGKPKCLPLAKASAMDKEDRAAAARRKRREDPVADRSGKGGKPINVATEEYLQEKNVPTNPTLWARAKTLARSKFDVYPSAYANGWAAKWYKGKGGGWKSVQEGKQMKSLQNILEGVVVSADFKVDKKGRKYRAKRKVMNPVKDDTQESSVVSSIQKFVGRQYEEVEQLPIEEKRTEVKDANGKVISWKDEGEWKKRSKKNPVGRIYNLSDKARKQTEKIAQEEVEPVNEISKDLAHSYFKQRYAQTGATRQDKPKDMPRATHDKRLQGMDRARRRLTTTLTLPKGVDPSEGGKYTADSVQHDNENTIVEVKLSAAARLQRALQKAKEDRERKQRLAQPFVDNVFGKKDQKKDMGEAKDPREYDYEGDMAKSQLRSIIANSQAVHDMLKDTTNMAEWVQSKITKAEDYMSTVADYMTAEVNEAKDDDEDYSKHHKLDDDSGVEADQHIHVQLKKAIDSTMKPYEVTFKDGKKHTVSSPVAKTIVNAVDKLKPEHRKDVHDELHKSYDSLMGVHKMIAGK